MLTLEQTAALVALETAVRECARRGVFIGASMSQGFGLVEIDTSSNFQDTTLAPSDVSEFIERESRKC